VDDVHQRVGFTGPDVLGRILGEPVELGDPVLEQGKIRIRP